MVSKKERRHSGRKAIFVDDLDYPTQFDFYSEWDNWRDGMRFDPDETHIRSPRMLGNWKEESITDRNKKLLKHLMIRKQRRFKQALKNSS